MSEQTKLVINEMSELKRRIMCVYCGMLWEYDNGSQIPELVKKAGDHEAVCEKNPHTAQIRNLRRERDEARKEAEYYKERYEQIKDERDEERAQLLEEVNDLLK